MKIQIMVSLTNVKKQKQKNETKENYNKTWPYVWRSILLEYCKNLPKN